MSRFPFFDDQPDFRIEEQLRLSHRDRQRRIPDVRLTKSERMSAHVFELVESLVAGQAVVYVGAGASKAAGLPDWKSFLHQLQRESARYSLVDAEAIYKKIEEGDYLVAAEMLQNTLGNRLHNITHRIFGTASVPTAIHKTIAAIPFSLAITTNYDSLLESAYHFPAPRLTWQNPYDVLQNLRNGIFCVLKLHGDYAVRKSVILARSHYRDLMHLNQALLHSLRTLLATRTFLFVGVSFSDPDLLSLLDEARCLYGDSFGPHYAIIPEEYYVPAYSEVLERSYNIRTLISPTDTQVEDKTDAVTSGVASMIAHIGGFAAYSGRFRPFRHGLGQFLEEPTSQSKTPGERLQMQWLLQNLVLRLGVQYGEVCMVKPAKSEHRVIYRSMSYSVQDKNVVLYEGPEAIVEQTSLQARLFLQKKIDSDYALINNVSTASEELESQGFYSISYVSRSPTASTSLSVPIHSDGKRTGVVTVEAPQGYLFSRLHYELVREFASKFGTARHEAYRIDDSARHLRWYAADIEGFQRNLRRSRLLDDLKLSCLLYQIDPFKGELTAPLRNEEEIRRNKGRIEWSYKFEDRSLACQTFRERRTIREPDAETCGSREDSFMARRGRKFFSIDGPVFAFPIHVRGYTAGVFVGWSDAAGDLRNCGLVTGLVQNKHDSDWRLKFWRGMERARRILHLLANEPGTGGIHREYENRAKRFLDTVANAISDIDYGKSWGMRIFTKSFRRRIIDALLKCLVDASCGLMRTRLFVVHQDKRHAFDWALCVGSQSLKDCNPPVTSHRKTAPHDNNGYFGLRINGPDDYIAYTLNRAEYDPYTRLQDRETLGGVDDPSEVMLDKVPGGSWLVSPVGLQKYSHRDGQRTGMRMCGYLAGDMFRWDAASSQMIDVGYQDKAQFDGHEMIYQRYCMDVISDMLAPLMSAENIDPSPRKVRPPSSDVATKVRSKAK